MFVVTLVVLGVLVLTLFYRDYKTIEKLTKEIGELSADNELLQIDLDGQKLFTKVYENFLESCNIKEKDLMDELETLQHKNVKKSSKKEKENKKTKK